MDTLILGLALAGLIASAAYDVAAFIQHERARRRANRLFPLDRMPAFDKVLEISDEIPF